MKLHNLKTRYFYTKIVIFNLKKTTPSRTKIGLTKQLFQPVGSYSLVFSSTWQVAGLFSTIDF